MKKVLWIALAVLTAAGICVGIMFKPLVKAASSVTQLDEGVYYMEFTGDDGFDGFIEQGGAANSQELAAYVVKFLSHGIARMPQEEPQEQDFGCSTLAVKSPDGECLFGRNFDWHQARCIITKVRPKGGYSYISAFNMDFFGFGDEWKPEDFSSKYMLLASLFGALDGINEKGLAIADLTAGENEEIHQHSGKPAMTTTTAIKYLLKSAATVDEAVALLEGIEYHSEIGCLHHLSMADASGKNVVVEWVGEKMYVTETPVVTNHYLCPENFGAGKYEGDCRFETLEAVRDSLGGTMDQAQLLAAMAEAWQSWTDGSAIVNGGTQWTALFDLSTPAVDYVWQRDTSRRNHFSF